MGPIVLLYRCTWSNPLTVLQTSDNTTLNVEVLIPPPVEEDEAPININMINKNSIGMPTDPMSIVLKPDVLVTLWKIEVVNLPYKLIPSITPFHSRTANEIAPIANRIREK